MRLIILAAGMGSRLAPFTDDRPKCLVELGDRPILEWTLDAAKVAGIEEVVVIGGYRADQLSRYNVTLLVNEDYATTNMVHTLFMAQEYFGDGFIMSYGDIAYTPSVLKRAIHVADGVNVVIDEDWQSYWEQRFDNPLDDAETLKLGTDGKIMEIGNPATSFDDVEAQYIGLVTFKGKGVETLNNAISIARMDQATGKNPFGGSRTLDSIYMTDLLQGMIGINEQLTAVPIKGQWLEIDTRRDLKIAENLLKQGHLSCRSEEIGREARLSLRE